MLPLEQIKQTIETLHNQGNGISRLGLLNNTFTYFGLKFSKGKVELINLYKKNTNQYYEVTKEFELCQDDFLMCIKKIRKKYKEHEYCKKYL